MKIRDLKIINPYYAEFILEGDYKEANLLRKYLMGRVPVYAIDSVLMRKNTTAYPIEYIAHRLGMIPIRVNSKSPASEYRAFLSHKERKVFREITSRDIMFESSDVEVAEYYPEGVKNKNGYDIIDILPGQEIDLELVIRPGIGFRHSKFQTALSSYEQISDTEYRMFVETTFQYTAEELIRLAMSYIKEDLKAFDKIL
ncbi:MAG: hypothetical protein N3C61_01980 [Candidatus Micrarchaeota archaeon]|nr:hypothetical protein [Candidatus Micrarchaeota archaeon]